MFGLVVGRLGGKNVITFSMAASAALTLLVPVLARASVYALIAGRVGIGIFTVCELLIPTRDEKDPFAVRELFIPTSDGKMHLHSM